MDIDLMFKVVMQRMNKQCPYCGNRGNWETGEEPPLFVCDEFIYCFKCHNPHELSPTDAEALWEEKLVAKIGEGTFEVLDEKRKEFIEDYEIDDWQGFKQFIEQVCNEYGPEVAYYLLRLTSEDCKLI